MVRNRKLQLIILLVLVSLVGTMSIAYAVLSTTLNINGTAQVQDASWNVHFSNIQVNPYSVEINPVITDNNKVNFSADLTEPGDFYKFTVDIVNEGSIDAMIESIAKTPELTIDQKKYLRYEVEYVDGASINDSQLLKSGETKTISVLFSYRNDIPTSDLPTTENNFDLEIVLVYVQADTTGIEISGKEKLVKVVSGDLNTVGSEICIDEECFYLMKNDGENVTMLAKYNLYVGGKFSTSWVAYGNEATGLQDPQMIGYDLGVSNGSTNFCLINYWFSNGIKIEYGTSFPIYAYDSNSVVYNYVENYKVFLENLGVVISKSRLVKIEELEELGCIVADSNCNSAPKWVYSTTYWTGSASSEGNIHGVDSVGRFDGCSCNDNRWFGVRPIVEVPLTEF